MKSILLLLVAASLLTTAGCIFPGHRGGGGEYREHGEFREHGDSRDRGEYRSYPEPGVKVRIQAE
jgi:hypothetical protein